MTTNTKKLIEIIGIVILMLILFVVIGLIATWQLGHPVSFPLARKTTQ